MVVTAFCASSLVNLIGVRYTLALGTIGYAPYAAGLYTNNRFGTEWSVLFGAALCGLSAGVFWATEAAVALSYPEPERQGKFLGFWLVRIFCSKKEVKADVLYRASEWLVRSSEAQST